MGGVGRVGREPRGGMKTEHTTYRERTPGPAWVRAILWGAIVLGCYLLLIGSDVETSLMPRLAIVGAVVCMGVAVEVFLNGLTVLVQETRVFMYLGMFPLVRRSVPLSDIVTMESVRYQPIREFGGWGVRGWGKRKAWSARGSQAVALTLEGERLLLIGSDHPRRLEERIRAASGESTANSS